MRLIRALISEENTPHLARRLGQAKSSTSLVEPAFPAVTKVAQTTYLTGAPPSAHGIVANGYYDRSCCEVRNWHQSAKLVQHKRIFDELKAKAAAAGQSCTVFVNCWWLTMYDENIDFLVTPRPQYLQDGGKVADVYTHPDSLRDRLQKALGVFPLHRFWGPLTTIESSQWIAKASQLVDEWHDPTLSLIYLPHLDYCLQKSGPDDTKIVPKHLREIDELVNSLLISYEQKHPDVRVVILSEYGISPVSKVVHINKTLRDAGYLKVRTECGGETLDCGASAAFAVSDHQVAHVYIRQPDKDLKGVQELLSRTTGIQAVLNASQQNAYYNRSAPNAAPTSGVYHAERGGNLVAVAAPDAWFSYYYWNSPDRAPDFARCVAIHRKPGYDPAEMFFRYSPAILGALWLFFKIFLVYVLHIRTTVNATPLNADMIRGSHGRIPEQDAYKPLCVTCRVPGARKPRMRAEDVYAVLMTAVTQPAD